ncbi:MAG: hypothetical protein NXI04_26895 [Planctomycetaceae bacterium]|nr:hypothetical protein [Planctomycetaceae bacterium]
MRSAINIAIGNQHCDRQSTLRSAINIAIGNQEGEVRPAVRVAERENNNAQTETLLLSMPSPGLVVVLLLSTPLLRGKRSSRLPFLFSKLLGRTQDSAIGGKAADPAATAQN